MKPIAELIDFSPADTGLDKPIRALLWEYQAKTPPQTPCSRDAFLALLAGIPAMRKTPGIPGPEDVGPQYFTTLPQCPTKRDTLLCRRHLKSTFGITDRNSLLQFCNSEDLRCQEQYLDFCGFWEGYPPCDLSELEDEELEWFLTVRDFSAQFYPLTQRHGYLAWDIGECVGHLRAAYACGILSREELDSLSEYWILQAQSFHSWTEYAVSTLCGQLYWNFREQVHPSMLQEGQNLWLRLTRFLLDADFAWGSGMWYTPPQEKQYLLWPGDLLNMLPNWAGPDLCFATDQITVDGKPVGYCCRVPAAPNSPDDSGWRFFSGEESDDYLHDPSHLDMFHLNDVCNCDPDIVPLLTAPTGTAFSRREDGSFARSKLPE